MKRTCMEITAKMLTRALLSSNSVPVPYLIDWFLLLNFPTCIYLFADREEDSALVV